MNTQYKKQHKHRKNNNFYAKYGKSKKQLARTVNNIVRKTEKSKVQMSEEDKKKLEDIQALRNKIREEAYERRQKNAIKRKYKSGKKSPEELKTALETLKVTNAAIKNWDIMCDFPIQDKQMIQEMLLNEKIHYSILSNSYLYIRNASTDVLTKLRKIMPDEVKIWPRKAKPEKNRKIDTEGKEKTKVIDHTAKTKKAVKSPKKSLKLKVLGNQKKLTKIAA